MWGRVPHHSCGSYSSRLRSRRNGSQKLPAAPPPTPDQTCSPAVWRRGGGADVPFSSIDSLLPHSDEIQNVLNCKEISVMKLTLRRISLLPEMNNTHDPKVKSASKEDCPQKKGKNKSFHVQLLGFENLLPSRERSLCSSWGNAGFLCVYRRSSGLICILQRSPAPP